MRERERYRINGKTDKKEGRKKGRREGRWTEPEWRVGLCGTYLLADTDTFNL